MLTAVIGQVGGINLVRIPLQKRLSAGKIHARDGREYLRFCIARWPRGLCVVGCSDCKQWIGKAIWQSRMIMVGEQHGLRIILTRSRGSGGGRTGDGRGRGRGRG